MSNEIEPTRKTVEGEVITEKTPEQAGRELGVALANLSKGLKAIGEGFKRANGKPPIVIEDTLTSVMGGERPGQIEFILQSFEEDYEAEKAYIDKLWELRGKRVRVTIEVLEDN